MTASIGLSRWMRLPITQARYCETARCQGRRRKATTFHAVIDVPEEPDCAWVACVECTRLMEAAYAR